MEITNITKIVIAYVVGQIPVCMAGGFVILFALLVGIKIATPKQKGEHKKSYLGLAKVPGKKDERRTSEMDEGF